MYRGKHHMKPRSAFALAGTTALFAASALLTGNTATAATTAASTSPPTPDACLTPNTAATCVLDWELDTVTTDPGTGLRTTPDSGPLGHDGAVGTDVTDPVINHISFLTDPGGGPTFVRFDRHPPGAGIYYGLEHLIDRPDAEDNSLDPGNNNFSIEIRYRTNEKFGNIIQKGQAGSLGGQIKIQQPKGKVSCMFKTETGTATAGSGTTLLNDNAWHTLRCDRTRTSVTMYIDGVKKSQINHTTGDLNNTKDWTLGGKLNCDVASGSTADSCDYYADDVDYVHLWKTGDVSAG
jgi:Laminin G domain